jgi:hypothetical protein
LSVLFEHASEQKIEDMKFSAILHGADKDELENKSSSTKKANSSDNLLFGDPAEYAKMGEKERKDLSDKMRAKFRSWAGVRNG